MDRAFAESLISHDSRGFRGLLLQAQEGDRSAMDRVLSILRPHLEPLARVYAAPGRAAESTGDLLQEGCLRAWQKIGSFETADNDDETFAIFRAWMGQIVRRLGVDAQRARKRKRRSPSRRILSIGSSRSGDSTASVRGIDPPGPQHRPSAFARANELDREIRTALERMEDPRDAAIVRMHLFDGLPLSRISRELDLGYDLVRDHYWAAMARLRRDFRDWL